VVTAGEELELEGDLELFAPVSSLQADGTTSGFLKGTGTIDGGGILQLAIDMDGGADPDVITYDDTAFANKGVSAFITLGIPAPLNTATFAQIVTIFGLGPDTLAFFFGLSNIPETAIPVGKTLVVYGNSSLVNGVTTFAPAGTLANYGTITTDTTAEAVLRSLLGYTHAPSSSTNGEVVVTGAITTLTGNLTVPAGVTLTLSGASTFASGNFDVIVNGTLALGNTVALALTGNDVTVNGTLELDGAAAIAADTVTVTGNLDLTTSTGGITGDVAVTGALVVDGSISDFLPLISTSNHELAHRTETVFIEMSHISPQT
jgi:hypothetical protein